MLIRKSKKEKTDKPIPQRQRVMATNLWHSAEAIIIIWARFVSGLNTEFSLIKYRKINLPIERNNGFAYVVSPPFCSVFILYFSIERFPPPFNEKQCATKINHDQRPANWQVTIQTHCETKKREMPVNAYCSLSTTAA